MQHCFVRFAFVFVLLAGVSMNPSLAEPVAARLEEGHPVNPGVFAANNTHLTPHNPMGNPAYRALVRGLGITSMRYGGGSTASFWDWQTGKYVPKDEITAIWSGEGNWMLKMVDDVNALPEGTLSPLAYHKFAKDTGIDLQWVVNVTTREQSQAAFFDHLHEHGVGVDYVEMDNETYFWSNEFGIDAESGRRYGQRVAELAPHIKSLYPDARIGIVASEDNFFTAHHTKKRDDRWKYWNQMITSEDVNPYYDAFILHHYVMGKGRLDSFDNHDDRARAFLALPQVTLERAADLIQTRYGDYPMWITEFNVICYYEPMAGNSDSDQWIRETKYTTWAALYQAGFWLTALSHPEAIEVLNHHSVTNVDIGWGLAAPVSETEIDITAQGQLFVHLAHLAKTHDTMHAVSFDHNPSLGVEIEDVADVVALHGAALQKGGQTTLLVMNRGREAVEFVWPGADDDAKLTSTIYDTAAATPEPVQQTSRAKLIGDQPVWAQGPMQPTHADHDDASAAITLPPYSLAVLSYHTD